MVESQPLIVAGPKKSLKTSILIDMAISLAMGGLFLGKFKVAESVHVGIMTGESGLPFLQETFLRICRAAGYDPASVGRLVITDQVPIFASPEHQAAIKSWAMEHELQVLIIDPAYMCLDGTDAGIREFDQRNPVLPARVLEAVLSGADAITEETLFPTGRPDSEKTHYSRQGKRFLLPAECVIET